MLHRYSKLLTFVSIAFAIAACTPGARKPVIEAPQNIPGFVQPVLLPEHQQLYASAINNIHNGLHSEAITSFNQLLDFYPALAGAYVNLGLIAEQQNEMDKAYQHYKKALTINPANTDALLLLGKQEIQRGEFFEAEKSLLKASATDSDNAAIHFNLGVLYELYLQRYDDAVDHYERYIEIGAGSDIETVKRWIKLLERK